MYLKEIVTLLNGNLLMPGTGPETECTKVFASDLMSDVLAFMDPGSLLVTGLVNCHAVRTARLADVIAIVFVQGKQPDAQVVEAARQCNLPLVTTSLSMFDACSRLSGSFRR